MKHKFDRKIGYKLGNREEKKTTHFWVGLSFYGYLPANIGYKFSFQNNSETGYSIDREKQFTPETGITILDSKKITLIITILLVLSE